MHFTKRLLGFGILVLSMAALVTAQVPQQEEQLQVGPMNGSLVIVGGAMRDEAIVERIIELAGGPNAPLVLIPTAGGGTHYDQYWSGQNLFRKAGATNITILHTYDPKVADTDEFVKPITKARGVFFGGGRQWRLADAYLDTKTHRELMSLLDRGGVIGGSSAGASIMADYLIRGDTKTNTIMMGDHLQGFGFLKNIGIDQHLLRRNRQFDMLEVIDANPNLLGIGLDENTAIVVHGDHFEVIGQSYAIIYDDRKRIPPDGRFYFLAPGDRYNMATREATRSQQTQQPIARVKNVPEP